ncbi:SH3 domain-containing protein [Paramyrothecium foliicola]|nr:SH3 domain-containing protein [Paramyrothecium foliicola]
MGINNPLPSSMASECKKCGRILTSFINPRQAFGPEKVIPPSILAGAKGLAVITVLKAGFLGSGRFGSGLVVARLPDGSWSAPSAIATAGAGFGGQIGFELTDFVFILNDMNAVKTFAQAGSLTLGGNVSLAAGPVGRNAEAAGAASLKSVAGIFSYSKTKGLFAGVSLEGSAIIERRDANEKLYGTRYTAQQLLSGSVPPPPQAAPLMSVLNSRIFSGMRAGSATDDSMYNDVPVYDDRHDDVVWNGNRGSAYGEGSQRDDGFGSPRRANTWQDDVYDRQGFGGPPSRSNTFASNRGGYDDDFASRDNSNNNRFGEKSGGPGRPTAPKPVFGNKQTSLAQNEAIALFNFEADQPGDLGFKKGDVITVLKKTESDNDWWTDSHVEITTINKAHRDGALLDYEPNTQLQSDFVNADNTGVVMAIPQDFRKIDLATTIDFRGARANTSEGAARSTTILTPRSATAHDNRIRLQVSHNHAPLPASLGARLAKRLASVADETKMAPTAGEIPLHSIERTPEYEDFMNRLREYHVKRGTTLDPEPKVGAIHLDLFKVFNHIVANGGYDKVSEEKLAWRRMAAELGLYSNNEASTAFALKEKFYKNLAAFEISTVHGKEPPPKEILEDVTAKGASLLTRTKENYRGKRESNIGATDSAASGDDGTPVRERPVVDAAASARASRGLREAPPQRVIFQPDTGSSRTTRQASTQQQAPQASSPAVNATQSPVPHASMPQMPPSAHHNARGPSIVHHPPNPENTSYLVTQYQPRQTKPLPLRAVATPSTAPSEFQKPRVSSRYDPANRQPMQPGVGFDGPNIYMRCLNALRSKIPAEQAFALNHLVKISFERGDKYKFDSFPGLAEGLVEKALTVGSLFYHVDWQVSWDTMLESSDPEILDGNSGTHDILERIANLIEKDTPDMLQTENTADELVLITEAILTIRNMVTLPENAHNMSDFAPLKDLICILLHLPAKEAIVELKHLALDIAEQLTPFMILDAGDPLYQTLLSQMTSEDRGTILTALRALGRISVNLEATNKLGDVPRPILQRIADWLLLNDDELLDACLDFLYQYTAVVPNVDNLMRALVPEDLVDHLVRLLAHGARKVHRELVLAPTQKIPARDEIAPMPDDLLQEMLKLEEPDRVHRWVRSFFEEDNDSFVTQLAAWQAYQSAFVTPLKAVGQPLITPADFIRNSTSVYKDSNAQVLREPGDPQQKFIIHGIRPRPRPLSLEGSEYGRCLWATNPLKKNEKCGQFYLTPEQMWNHILTAHLHEIKRDDGHFENVEKEFVCTWGECNKFDKPTKLFLRDHARHINTHILSMMSGAAAQAKDNAKPWIIPAKTMAVTYEETVTVRDERNPNAPPQAAGIPLSAVLVLRNIARNVVKTDAEEELLKQHGSESERGGWNEKMFRPVLQRLFEILAENKAMSPYIASLLDLIRTEIDTGETR